MTSSGSSRTGASSLISCPLAQLAEQVTVNHWVRGSSPRGAATLQAHSSIGQSNGLINRGFRVRVPVSLPSYGSVAESAYAADLKSAGQLTLWVRVPPELP